MTTIQYQKGNIFDSKAQVIVNTVNCEGVMGKGLALEFKQRYPDMFAIYQQDCKTGRLRIGRPTLYQKSTPWILNFPTKNKWRANSKLEYLEKGLEYFVANYQKAGITSIAFPKLGTQNGNLSWDDVGPLMAKYLSQVDIDVYIYIVDGDRHYQYGTEKVQDNSTIIWQKFNELALSLDRLQQEVLLSKRAAKKIVDRRAVAVFTSQADIDSIEELAQISRKQIKKYIHNQMYIMHKLPDIEKAGLSYSVKGKEAKPSTKKKPGTGKKKSNTSTTIGTLATSTNLLLLSPPL
jgi:O-acetyl-ADP-ribose deacetylase (regulator of RNase III)